MLTLLVRTICALATVLLIVQPKPLYAATTITDLAVVTPGVIEKYAKFEVAFQVQGSPYTNPYFPYDTANIPGLAPGTGISVDAFFLPPGGTDWDKARRIGCFYFQPYDPATLVAKGAAQWRCRFTPEVVGEWQYRIQVADKNGVVQTPINRFTAGKSARKGFIRVSQSDPRFFEFADGTPFVAPLVNFSPLRSGTDLKRTLATLGRNGLHFLRWFPTTEDGSLNLFGDGILSSWTYGGSYHVEDPDTAHGRHWSYSPYYYSAQAAPLTSGSQYRLSFRAHVSGEQVLEVSLANAPEVVVCSATNAQHSGCTARQSGWNDYSVTFTADSTGSSPLYIRGLYVSTDAPAPYDEVRNGAVRINEVRLQRDETGSGGWGPNLVSRGDADTWRYVDQNQAAIMDQLLTASETASVYHKLTLFHKNDGILNFYDENGHLADWANCDWGRCPNHFYAGDGQMVRWLEQAYMRYFLARWSYSPAIHSLEFVNESDLYDQAQEAGRMYARFIAENASRPILTSNSFFGYWVDGYFKDPVYGQYLDYSDQHWYANRESHDEQPISTIWQDTVANVRQCYLQFRQYAARDGGYAKPFVRGETGVAVSGTQPQDPAIAAEKTGTYYHKKVWAHVGLLGYTCDGEWYPRLFVQPADSAFPNRLYDTFKIYAAYARYIAGEPLNNGTHIELGTDLTGTHAIRSTSPSLRAYGSQDPVTARALIWVDNKNNTWLKPDNNAGASGTISIAGMPTGSYTQETWDTRAGVFTKTTDAVKVGADGVLRFSVSTSKDIAYKFYLPGKRPLASSSPYLPPACKP